MSYLYQFKKSQLQPKMVVIGAPLVDYTVKISEEELKKNISGKKGGMELVPSEFIDDILKKFPVESINFAGSAVNVAKATNRLGIPSYLIGKIGKDSAGNFFQQKANQEGIKTNLTTTNSSTARVICFITPDGERTLRSNVDAASEITTKNILPNIPKEFTHLHIEGYCLFYENIVEDTISYVKKNHPEVKISFDLGSFEVVNLFKDRILKIIKNIDFLFSNKLEFSNLVDVKPEQLTHDKILVIAKKLNLNQLSITSSSNDSIFLHYDKIYSSKPPKVNSNYIIDSTGAGDFFAGTFLANLYNGKEIKDCLENANLVASNIVQMYGTDVESLDNKLFNKNSSFKFD